MRQVYNWMELGTRLTVVVAYATVHTALFIVALIAEFGMVMASASTDFRRARLPS